MAFSQGMVSGTDVPIEHLDYGYIGKCNKASEVETLLKILRSKKEGYYPDLIKFTEHRLAELNPKSKLLIKTEKARKLQDLPNSDSHGIMADLEQWEEAVKGEEAKLKATPTTNHNAVLTNGEDADLPPIRKAGGILAGQTGSTGASRGGNSAESAKRIASGDFRAWEKYDVEAECAKVVEEKGEKGEGEKGGLALEEIKLTQRELNMSPIEREKLSMREKEKGNEAFRSGDYTEALTYYSRSIALSPCAAAYNNRAITLIKLGQHRHAILDCNKVLQLEPSNTKALLRRGMAGASLNEWSKAEGDMEMLLKLEPKSKKAQEILRLAREELAKLRGAERKGRKVQIEEVDEEEEEEGPPSSDQRDNNSKVTSDPTSALPMPADVVKLKEQGNELFRRGQYGEAGARYTDAMLRLETAGKGHEVSVSTLLNNRAACHLKNGNSRACVADCTKSLQLVPINVKSLVRRAQAYEFLEKYRLAYVDNQLALSLDRNLTTVYDANSRISTLLKDLDGNSWREKLPQHPDQERVNAALNSLKSRTTTSGGGDTTHTTHPTTDGGSRDGDTNPTTHPTTDGGSRAGDTTPATHPTTDGGSRAGDTTTTHPTTDGGSRAGDTTPTTHPTTDGGSRAGDTTSTAHLTNDHSITSRAIPTKQSVTTSTATNSSMKVTQAATPITTPTSSSPSQAPPEPTDSVKFDKAKAKGNEHVKKGRWLEALNCYSLCILARPDMVVGYTNRALCHLKLNAPAQAEEDCSKALELVPANIKALYRRALARKSMKKFSDSLKDLKLLLERDGDNSAARGEYSEVKQLWEKELRHLQASGQQPQPQQQQRQQREKKPPHNNKKKSNQSHKNKSSSKEKEREKSLQQTELERLLAETKSRMKELQKKEVPGFPGNPADFLTANKTTYYKGTDASTKQEGEPSSKQGDQLSTKQKDKQGDKPSSKQGGTKQGGRPSTKQGGHKQGSTKQGGQPSTKQGGQPSTKQGGETQPSEEQEGQAAIKQAEAPGRRRKVVVEEEEMEEEETSVETERATGRLLKEGDDAGEGKPVSGGEEEKKSLKERREEEEPREARGREELEGEKKLAGKTASDFALTSYEFVQRWTSTSSRADPAKDHAALLRLIPPDKLPAVIHNQLDGDMLSGMVTAISQEMLPGNEYLQSAQILDNLSKVSRFRTIVMFLGREDKRVLGDVLTAIQDSDSVAKAVIAKLRKDYGLNT